MNAAWTVRPVGNWILWKEWAFCQQSYTNTQSCTCTDHVQERDRKQRIIHMFADCLLFSYLLTSILSSPACSTPISTLLSPASMSSQVRGCLVYKRPGEFASQEAQKCIKRDIYREGPQPTAHSHEENLKCEPVSLMESRSGVSSFPPLSFIQAVLWLFHIYEFLLFLEFSWILVSDELRMNCVVFVSFTVSSPLETVSQKEI